MIISESKLKGIIAVCLILALIPFGVFVARSLRKAQVPVFADQCGRCLAVEIVEGEQRAGLYFVPQGMSVNQLLKSAGIPETAKHDFQLITGMKINIHPKSSDNIVVTEMPNATKISGDLPIDINKASMQDLILIRGIGPVTAQKIIELRESLHGIKDMRQLMAIKGIKEKRLTKIQKYLFVKK